MNAPDVHRLNLGAYVLGALDAEGRTELESHLATCAACQEELVQLAGLPGLLRQLSLEEASGAAGAEDHLATQVLADRALADLRRRRTASAGQRQRLAVLAAAATVLGVLTLGSFATGVIGDGWFSPGTTVTATNPANNVHASVRMHGEAAGTELVLRLSGVPEKQRCLLVAIGHDGTQETAATWLANYQGSAHLEGYTSLGPDQMMALEIRTPDGRTLLHVAV